MPTPSPTPPNPPRILVVEDEAGIAETIHYALASDGFAPEVCGTAKQALESFARTPPALAILDIGLPDLNGFELLRRLHDLPGGKALPVVFLTARTDEIDRVVGLEMGADDYIAKPFSPRELVARVRGILRRSRMGADAEHGTPQTQAKSGYLASEKGAAGEPHGAFLLHAERRQIRYRGRALDLSRYEYGLLSVLIQRPGRVFTRDELLELVWDDPGASFDRTVDAHIKTLRAKLRAIDPDDEPIRTLRGIGYALREGG